MRGGTDATGDVYTVYLPSPQTKEILSGEQCTRGTGEGKGSENRRMNYSGNMRTNRAPFLLPEPLPQPGRNDLLISFFHCFRACFFIPNKKNHRVAHFISRPQMLSASRGRTSIRGRMQRYYYSHFKSRTCFPSTQCFYSLFSIMFNFIMDLLSRFSHFNFTISPKDFACVFNICFNNIRCILIKSNALYA